MAVASSESEEVGNFLAERLVGIDDDPFCVETAHTLLSLLCPEHQNQLKVFLHNGLYQEAPFDGEYDEDPSAESYLETEQYNVVIGNPPGNKQYSGSNASYVAQLWAERYGITTGLWDHVFFVKRAVELARPEGGREGNIFSVVGPAHDFWIQPYIESDSSNKVVKVHILGCSRELT